MASDILDRLSAASGRVRKGEGYFFMGGTNHILFGLRLVVLENMVEKYHWAGWQDGSRLTLGIPPLFTEMSVETGWPTQAPLKGNKRDLQEYREIPSLTG